MAEGAAVNLKLLITATNKASRTVQDVNKRLNELARSTERMGQRTARSAAAGKKSMDQWNASTARFVQTTEKAKKATDGFATAGLSLLGVAASLGAATFFPIKSAVDFEAAMSHVAAVTANAEEQFNELKATAAELGRTTKFTATEAAQGMVFLGQAGFDANEVISGIGPSLELAIAAGVDLSTAADIATNIVSAMRLKVEDLGGAVDILANTTANANTNLIQLADAMQYAGPLAAASKIRLEEVAGVMGVLGNNGIQASMAGTAVRGMLRALAAPTANAQKALDKLGVSVKIEADGSLNLVDALHQLARANLTAADANAIFGRFAAAGALAVTANVKELDSLIASNDAAAGAASKMAKIMKDNVKGAFIEFTSAVDGLKRAIGDPLLKPLKELLQVFTAIVGKVTAVAEAIPNTTALLVGLTAVVAALSAVVGILALAIGGLNTAFTILGKSGIVRLLTRMKGGFLLLDTAIRGAALGVEEARGSLALLKGALGKVGSAAKSVVSFMGRHWMATSIAAVGGLILIITELVQSYERSIQKTKELGQEMYTVNRSFDAQLEKLSGLEKGTEKYSSVAKAMREDLLDTAKKTKGLELEATKAANSINEMTGEIMDGGAALKEFQQRTKDLALDNMNKSIQESSNQIDRMNGKLKDWIALYYIFTVGIKTIRALIPGLSYSFKDLNAEMDNFTEANARALESSVRNLIKMKQEFGEFDESFTPEQVKVYFQTIEGYSESAATKAANVFAKMRAEQEKFGKASEHVAELSLPELNKKLDDSVAEVVRLEKAYESAKDKAAEAVAVFNKLPKSVQENSKSAQKAVADALRQQVEASQARIKAEETANKFIEGTRSHLAKETEKWYNKEKEQIERRKDLKIDEEWETEQALADLNTKRRKREKDDINSLLKVIADRDAGTLKAANEIFDAGIEQNKKIEEASKKSADTRIKHANEIKQTIIQSEREANSIRIGLMEDGPKKLQAQLEEELRLIDENAKKQGIKLEEFDKLKKALREKYAKEEDKWREERTLETAQIEADNAKEINQVRLNELDKEFDQRKINAETYARESTQIQQQMIQDELTYLQAALEIAKKKGEDNPVVVEVKYKIKRLEEKGEEVKKEEPDLAKRLKLREAQRQNQIDQELISSELDNMNIRNSNYEAMSNKRLELLQKQLDAEYLMLDAANASDEELRRKSLENEKAMAIARMDETRRIQEMKLTAAIETAALAEEAFQGLYEMGGQKNKALFYIEKAAAVARIIMSEQVAIAKAFEQGGWLGSIQAALISIKMAAAISKVRSASYASGGEVEGKSPHKRADNIPAWLTAKEWVMPVDTVKKYGRGVMEGLRKRIFPVEMFNNYRLPTPAYAFAGRRRFAEGGEAGTDRALRAGESKTNPVPAQPQPINIINVTDPAEMDRYLNTTAGQNAILNVLSTRSETVKRVLK